MKTTTRTKTGKLKATPRQRQEFVRAYLHSEGWADHQRRSADRWYVRAPEGWRFIGIESELVETAFLVVCREATARLAALEARAKARENVP